MNEKRVYILRYSDEYTNEQIGIFENKTLMFKALYANIRDDIDIDIDDPNAVLDVLDYYIYETDKINVALNTVYTLYERNSYGFDYISSFSIKPNESDEYVVVESSINQKDLNIIE